MVPFAAKFGYAEGELNEADLDQVAIEYARYFGHDPSGNWILVVHSDNTSEIFRFEKVEDMWCCKPNREQYLGPASSPFKPPFETSPIKSGPIDEPLATEE